ncbi:CocE/NonD family hydrolase [uncultured Cohaesibacter sp.]|uniref:CocE/NonD family hydrolase n=1 Tax=uncultured Cohaesibacter sp. TaxID=1002546 RepID=UPI00292F9892|nr:CocE/NonD family hydrolase [uncultured Cohaesibacter sp.]
MLKQDEIIFREAMHLDDPNARYPGFKQQTKILEKGYIHEEGAMPLPQDILMEQDVPVKLRDGTTIYTDIFRPVDGKDLPAIVAWSPYGKQGGTSRLDDIEGRYGIPKSATSGLEKWEGPDPAYWCPKGYAIINPDARGAWMSEGDIYFFGPQEGQDGYDLIEHVAAQPWSNGKVGLSGNSWLAIAQWFIAAECPPHLAAIAPWEGLNNPYRNGPYRGGIADFGFMDKLISEMGGANGVEDLVAMSKSHPLYDDYWKSKEARLDKVTIPAYVVGSWTNGAHIPGTYESFAMLGSDRKWLRIHNSHEWPDYYSVQQSADLKRFFDRYLKDIENGWEDTPKLRVSVVDTLKGDILHRPEADFPLPQTDYRKLHLHCASGALLESPAEGEECAVYDTDKEGKLVLTYQVDEDMELTGYLSLHVWLEVMDHTEADLFAVVQMIDTDGEAVVFSEFEPGFAGPHGRLRASHRDLDLDQSTPYHPVHLHQQESKLEKGELVELDIGLTPIGMSLHKGQQLRLTIAGFNPGMLKFDWVVPPDTRNSGRHKILSGNGRDSYLLVPVIPHP